MFSGRGIRILALEALGIAAVIGIAGAVIYYHQKPKPLQVLRRLAGREQNVSRSDRIQYGAALTADPRNPQRLLGGSSDGLSDTRIYTSQDGGRTWTSQAGPPLMRGNCNLDQPAVAITATGRQTFVFSSSEFCDLPTPKIQVATRKGAGRWRVQALFPVKAYARDAHFAVATVGKRVWIAWTRRVQRFSSTHVGYLVTSDDDGATWSKPHGLPVPQPFALSLAASARGDLYVIAADGDDNTLLALASRDGGRTFAVRRTVAAFAAPYDESCEGAFLPPQSQFCIPPTPRVALKPSGGLLVAWADTEANGTDGLRLAHLTPSLRVAGRIGRIGPPDTKLSDQFLPSLAVDRSDGTIWACYMDTFGDPYRRRAWPTCTASKNGGTRWAVPVRVAGPASDETQTAAHLHGYGTTAVVANSGVANVMWTDTRNILRAAEDIYAARVRERSVLR